MTDQGDDRTRAHVVLTNGTMVSHYRIVEKIGAGGMGEVYLAEDSKLGRKVALKFLPAQFSDDPDVKARFKNEACAAAALDHPNICPVYEIDEADNRTYIAMAFIEGESLRHRTKAGPIQIDDLIRIGVDIAKGLEEAHDKKIIHRDIKSANIMISDKGQVKITDFGLARLIDSSRLTKTGVMMGTVAYMSPEQVRGQEVNHRSDIWALGVVLYEMATGKLPFKGDRDQAITHQILGDDAEPISSLRTGVPLDLERIINKCLEKDPSNRYQHVDDLAVDLKNVRKGKVASESRERSNWISLTVIAVLTAVVLYLLFNPLFEQVIEQSTVDQPQSFDNPLADATFRKLTDIEGYKDATISPDGKFVAFVSDHDGEFDIWVSQVETGNTYNRTHGDYGDMRRGLQDVGFTANSSEIISFSTSKRQPIRRMPLLEGPLRKMLRDSVIMAYWSPDGRRVVYYTDGEGDPVFIANADGTNSRLILGSESGMHQHFQRWSHDGEWIYMNRGREHEYDTDLWRVRTDGSDLEQLTEEQLDVTYPTPISDRVVLFVAKDEEGDGPWLWAIDVETKITKRVSIGLEKYSSLSASLDGRRLAASKVKPEASLMDIWNVPILDSIATESDVTQLSFPNQRARAPRYGGGSLYFLSSLVAGDGLWKLENGKIEEVWDGNKSALYEIPAFSSDGRSVALALKRDGKQLLYLVNSDGSNLRLLTDSIDVRGTFSFSPDGKWIVTSGYGYGKTGMFKISVENGSSDLIAEGFALDPVWSPKGDLIIYAGRQVSGFSTINAIRPDGQKVDFPEIEVYARGERYRFLPDGSGLVYMRGWFSSLHFWLLDLSTMETRQLTKLAGGPTMGTFDISPDGKNIVFDRLRVKTEIVLIELADDETRE